MPFILEKEKTASTPYVFIDEEKRYMKIAGESYHENIVSFFEEINLWLKKFLQTNYGELTVDCELEYFNSSTSKLLYNIFAILDDEASKGKRITVNWITSPDNEIIVECGEDYLDEMNYISFNIINKQL